jgi:hypothetical protein
LKHHPEADDAVQIRSTVIAYLDLLAIVATLAVSTVLTGGAVNDVMPNAYDVELRRRAVLAYERGVRSYRELADLFYLNPRTLERCVARCRGRNGFARRADGRILRRLRGLDNVQH